MNEWIILEYNSSLSRGEVYGYYEQEDTARGICNTLAMKGREARLTKLKAVYNPPSDVKVVEYYE